MPKPTTALHEKAMEVRQAYVVCRSEYESRKAGIPITYKPSQASRSAASVVLEDGLVLEKGQQGTWLTLAEGFLQRRLDPKAYIGCIFQYAAGSTRPPEPRQLFKPEYLDLWQRTKLNRVNDIGLDYKLQANSFEHDVVEIVIVSGVDHYAAAFSVLSSTSNPSYNAMFRYVVARNFWKKMNRAEFKPLCSRFRKDAQLLYILDQEAYNAAFDLPVKFRLGAEQAYKDVCRERYGVVGNV